MGDSDSERGGSDAGSDNEDDEAGFDPAKDLDKMTDKQRKKWEKSLEKWRIFMDFLFRHVAIVTYRFNCFEAEELMQFMMAVEKAETIREQSKLKKGEVPRISSFKGMKDAADLLQQQRFLNESNRIRRFLDIAGRMRGIGMIAGGFYKALKKGKVRGIDKIKFYLDHWKGFCVRSFDYSELTFRNTDPATFNDLERKYLIWPTAVKTALNLSSKFLKKVSESTGMELMTSDPKVMQQHMQAAEFVVAAKIEDMLFQKVVNESKNFLIGNPLLTDSNRKPTRPVSVTSTRERERFFQMPDTTDINPDRLLPIPDNGNPLITPGNAVSAKPKVELPELEDIDPAMIKPIPDSDVLITLPEEPPKEKKKGKKGKGKKGGKKGGRSSSASSHKGGKKKKRK